MKKVSCSNVWEKQFSIAFSTIAMFAMLFATQTTFAQYNRPWNSCYTAHTDSCTGCITIPEVTKTFVFNGCPIKVSYKIKQCNCPQPRIFVDIDYIRVDIASPEACCDLICHLHPPGPYTKNCDSIDYSLNCWNNPPNVDSLTKFVDTLYTRLMDTLFMAVQNNYHCPNRLTYEYYWPGSCTGYCVMDLVPTGQPSAKKTRLYQPTACDSAFCCGVTYTYCIDELDQVQRTITRVLGSQDCPGAHPNCPNVGTKYLIEGIQYTVVAVRSGSCVTSCPNK